MKEEDRDDEDESEQAEELDRENDTSIPQFNLHEKINIALREMDLGTLRRACMEVPSAESDMYLNEILALAGGEFTFEITL